MTATAALLPIAAATAQFLVREVSDVVKQGISFVEMLHTPDETGTATNTAAVSASASESLELTGDSQMVRWKTAWQNTDAQTAALHRILVEKLQDSGVDLSEAVVLMTDADGRVLAANGHPDRAADRTSPGIRFRADQPTTPAVSTGGQSAKSIGDRRHTERRGYSPCREQGSSLLRSRVGPFRQPQLYPHRPAIRFVTTVSGHWGYLRLFVVLVLVARVSRSCTCIMPRVVHTRGDDEASRATSGEHTSTSTSTHEEAYGGQMWVKLRPAAWTFLEIS